jgi:hypothetical protein
MVVLTTIIGAVTPSRVVNGPDLAQALLDAGRNRFATPLAL